MTKKMLIISLLLFLPFVVAAEDKVYSFSDFDTSCFRESAQFSINEAKVLKIESKTASGILFVYENEFLSNRIFDYGEYEYLDYEVADISGLRVNEEKNYSFLNDNNNSSGIFFDAYDTEEKSIILDLGSVQPARSLSFNFRTSGALERTFFISRDNLEYIKVRNVEDFDFRYLKIVIDNTLRDGEVAGTMSIQEINFLKPKNSVLLLKPNSPGEIKAYAGYECANKDSFQKALSAVAVKSAKTTFGIDIQTPYIILKLNENPLYNNDFDNDGIMNRLDNCPFRSNPDQSDIDGDGIGDVCDLDNFNKNFFDRDNDHDGIPDSLDNCPFIYNPNQKDSNADKKGDACNDDDRDGIIGYKDNCPNVYNQDQKDKNKDGIGDVCESDIDGDDIFDSVDNCVNIPNPDQEDLDNDNIGDVCDNCPDVYNVTQMDVDKDGVGDRCDDKDNRFIESNRKLFIALIILITSIFTVLIFLMIKKMKTNIQNQSTEDEEDNSNEKTND